MPDAKHKLVQHTNNALYTVLDLFCGVGGFSLGAARAGFNLIGAIDWDKDAMRMHEKNFPGHAHWQADITKLTGKDIRQKFGFNNVDVVIGGPPCQGFSRMGHQRVDDSRNDLFIKFFSLVSELAPRFFVAENVLGLLDEKNAPLVDRALSLVRKQYEVLNPIILRANEYGVPTSRTRVFFIGCKKPGKFRLSQELILDGMPQSEVVTVESALKGLPRNIHARTSSRNLFGWRKLTANPDSCEYFSQRLQGMIPKGVGDIEAIRRLQENGEVSGNQGTVHTQEVKKRWHSLNQGKQDRVSKARRLELTGFCHTIRAGTGRDMGSFQSLRPIHPTLDRVITPREAARLQSFPDWFQFDQTKWQSFRQIGNSVCPILAEKLLVSIKQLLESKS